MFKHFLAVLTARNKEFTRDRSSLAWNILFPFLLVVGLSLAFSNDKRDRFKIGVYPAEHQLQAEFLELDYIRYLEIDDLEDATVKVSKHQLDMLLDLSDDTYYVNDSAPNGYMLEQILVNSPGMNLSKTQVSGDDVRYVDWALPGILGMNLMFSCLFGVGYVIVRYRKNGVLKRLKATPLSAFSFLSAQVASRLLLSISVTIIIYIGTKLFLNTTMNGSHVLLLLVFVLGALSLISLSLLMSTRTSSEELAGGLLNLMVWPMMVLSGVWFSLEGAHPMLQKLSLIFPLTHVTSAARAIMIDSAGFLQILPNLLVLAVSTIVLLVLAAWFFKWE